MLQVCTVGLKGFYNSIRANYHMCKNQSNSTHIDWVGCKWVIYTCFIAYIKTSM